MSENRVANKPIWMELSEDDKQRYTRLMRELCTELTKQGFYDARIMKVLKRVRRTHKPGNGNVL